MTDFPPLPPPPVGGEPAPVVEDERPPSSPLKAVLAVGVVLTVVLALVVGGLVWLGAPGVCDASTVESSRFGYCLAAPGWEFTNEQSASDLPYDELVHPDASSVRILAVEIGAQGELDQVISDLRASEVEEGIELGEVRDTTVAGVPARQWDLTVESGDLELQVREVVFVRRGTAWRVQLITDREGFDTRLPEFQRILRSWIFR
jgi:hypothetical protein